MRALRIAGPRQAEVVLVTDPEPKAGELLINVERVGICGTDVELYTGEMAYFAQGRTTFPLRLGHEWVGVVRQVGEGVDVSWLGKRVTGDTMLGCCDCERCNNAKSYLCENRIELGITDGWDGALAEKMLIPVRYAFEIPATISVTAAAMIEPAGNALRAVEACNLNEHQKVLILGAGTIGLLAAQFALAKKFDVYVASHRESSLALARDVGVVHTSSLDEIIVGQDQIFDAVIDASSIDSIPNLALKKVVPGGRVVLIGLSSMPSIIDTRDAVLRDVAIVGILSASPGLKGAVEYFASGTVDPESLVSEVISLEEVASRLEGIRGDGAGPGPKIHVDPRK